MYTYCRICKLHLPSLHSLTRHHLVSHSKRVRCALCFVRFTSVRYLRLHYLRFHSKCKIVQQLMRCSSQNVIRPLKWMKIMKKTKTELKRPQPIMTPEKTEKLVVKGNIHISYGNKEIIVELSDDEESLEITIDDVPSQQYKHNSDNDSKNSDPRLKALLYDQNLNFSMKEVKSNEKLVISPQDKIIKRKRNISKKPKTYKHFCIEFVKPDSPKSLNHKTGQFYLCHCNKEIAFGSDKEDEIIMVTSDTESSSDNGKYSFYPIPDKKIYCNICGNGYRTKTKLVEHRKIHSFHCRTCGSYFPTQRQLSNHSKNHVFIYCCHICKLQFPQKLSLLNHLNCHQDRDIVKTVLDLEQNYNHYLINFNSDSYATSINNITSFLSSTDYKYNSNFFKVKCHLCSLEFFKCDFPQHMKMHYFFKNADYYFRHQVEYP